MNRRTFITSLLATTASIPMAKVVALATPVDPHAELMALLHQRMNDAYEITRQQMAKHLFGELTVGVYDRPPLSQLDDSFWDFKEISSGVEITK